MKNPALLEEMKTYKGRDEVPADFDSFWDQALANLQARRARFQHSKRSLL